MGNVAFCTYRETMCLAPRSLRGGALCVDHADFLVDFILDGKGTENAEIYTRMDFHPNN